MSFNSSASSAFGRLKNNAPAASETTGISCRGGLIPFPSNSPDDAPVTNQNLRFEDRLADLARMAQEQPGKIWRSTRNCNGSLAEAFAAIPIDLGFPVDCSFRVVVNGRERELKTEIDDQIYMIGREAILNACRHSGGTKIEIEVEYRATELRIVVRDNGCGIDPADLHWGRDGHLGLQGMRERAETIGARFRLLSRPELGTEVILSVPGRVAFAQEDFRFARRIGIA